ncbi:MAG: hypothetical protein AB7L28_28360, partial [Kofleriaceae bacterium]
WSHRIAHAAQSPTDASRAGHAIRCLRATGSAGVAELVSRALIDDAARAAAEKAAMVPTLAPKLSGDLVVKAHWTGGRDLDISVVTPDGARVSWMGGRTDATAADASSREREQLSIRSLRRGNYLIEVTRGDASSGPVRGTLEISALGTKRSLPFELLGSRAVVGKLQITLQEAFESVNDGGGGPQVSLGPIPDPNLQRVMMARTISIQQCYASLVASGKAANRIAARLAMTIDRSGMVRTTASGAPASLARCIEQQLAGMHTMPRNPSVTWRVRMTFTNR